MTPGAEQISTGATAHSAGEQMMKLITGFWVTQLHAYGDPLSAEGRAVKQSLRDCFHSDDPFWQGMALGQGLAACRAAIGGLHNR